MRRVLQRRLEDWEAGLVEKLIQETLRASTVYRGRLSRSQPSAHNDEHTQRVFCLLINEGKVRAAVRFLAERDKGGVLHPNESYELKGKQLRVREILLKKHPASQEPGEAAMKSYEVLPELPTLDITADTIETIAKQLQGGAGPSGVHALWWEHWLVRMGTRSEKLREAVAALARRLANDIVPWQDIRALIANRLIAFDKGTGVRPIGVGECLRRVCGKAVMDEAGKDLEIECGTDQLCAKLEAGIEGAVHTMSAEFDAAESGWGVLMVDAANAFNALNRKAALRHTRHLWPAAARYLYNTYKGWAVYSFYQDQTYAIIQQRGYYTVRPDVYGVLCCRFVATDP